MIRTIVCAEHKMTKISMGTEIFVLRTCIEKREKDEVDEDEERKR